ncbi:MAG: phosphoribosylanthranilate isomerase [Pseudomonadota bacterium]
MVRVKICGITNLGDASTAVSLGAHALGFVFAPSPRRVSPEKARSIIRRISPFVKTVGVFVNEKPDTIERVFRFCGLDLIQLHGDESPDLCEAWMPHVVKAFHIRDEASLQGLDPYQNRVKAFLLDTFSEKSRGGTGKSFDWRLAVKAKKKGTPIILSGGLNPANIEEAVTTVWPDAVDVNSGIEEGPGKKSRLLMESLMNTIDRIRRRGKNGD